jgi:hypothetical protein
VPDRDLKLNSLSRYSKQSPRLILEEYSSCEIPAGCGGVVMRWRNPDHDIPVPFSIYAEDQNYEAWLDQEPIVRSRQILTFGEHLLAFKLIVSNAQFGLLMVSASYDENAQYFSPRLSRPSGTQFALISEADGSWKYTAIDPGITWMGVSYDDTVWNAMNVKALSPITEERDPRKYHRERLQKQGAQPLGVNEDEQTVWIRKRFTVTKSREEE